VGRVSDAGAGSAGPDPRPTAADDPHLPATTAAGVPAVPAGTDLGVPDPAGSWGLDMAAATLRIDTGDTDALFEALGNKLQRILGPRAQVQREGGLRRNKRIAKIVVDTGAGRLEATRGRTGPVFLSVHAVRGITLQTAEIPADAWLEQLVAMVGDEASRSAEVRNALGQLLDS
jgi:hypothetical protein